MARGHGGPSCTVEGHEEAPALEVVAAAREAGRELALLEVREAVEPNPLGESSKPTRSTVACVRRTVGGGEGERRRE